MPRGAFKSGLKPPQKNMRWKFSNGSLCIVTRFCSQGIYNAARTTDIHFRRHPSWINMHSLKNLNRSSSSSMCGLCYVLTCIQTCANIKSESLFSLTLEAFSASLFLSFMAQLTRVDEGRSSEAAYRFKSSSLLCRNVCIFISVSYFSDI